MRRPEENAADLHWRERGTIGPVEHLDLGRSLDDVLGRWVAPEAPWRCPENCPAFKPRLADVGWSYGTLQSDLGPPRPEGLDETAAALLDEAEDIVNAVGPEILAEFRQQDERRGLGAWLGRLKRRR